MKKPPLPVWPFILVSFFAAGCSLYGSPFKLATKKSSMRFQVDEDSNLYGIAVAAAAQWAQATGRSITATPDGDIPIVLVSADDWYCPNDTVTPAGMIVTGLGCSKYENTPDARIEILEGQDEEHYRTTMLHEMGHHLRGDSEHLDDPSSVMNAVYGATQLTARDVAFICEKFDCVSAQI